MRTLKIIKGNSNNSKQKVLDNLNFGQKVGSKLEKLKLVTFYKKPHKKGWISNSIEVRNF